MAKEINQCSLLNSTPSQFGSGYRLGEEESSCRQASLPLSRIVEAESDLTPYKYYTSLDEQQCKFFCKPSWYYNYRYDSSEQMEARFWNRYNLHYKYHVAEPFKGVLRGEELEQTGKNAKREVNLITDIWSFLFKTKAQDQTEARRLFLISQLFEVKSEKVRNVLRTLLLNKALSHLNYNNRSIFAEEVFNYAYEVLTKLMSISRLYGDLHHNEQIREIAKKQYSEFATLYNHVWLVRSEPENEEESQKNKRLSDIQDELGALRERFEKNFLGNYPKIELPAEMLKGFPENFKKLHPVVNNKITVELNPGDYVTFLDYADPGQYKDERIKAIQLFTNRSYPANVQILEEILKKGQEYVDAYQHFEVYKTFAAYDFGSSTNGVILENPDYASRIIEKFKEPVKRIALAAYQEVLDYKKRSIPNAEKVEVWESRYWSRLLYEEKYQLFESEKNESKKYLQPKTVFTNALKIIEKIYDVKLLKFTDPNKWHPDVESYLVIKNGQGIGFFYLDLYKRDKKPESYPYLFTYQKSDLGKKLPVAVAVANFTKDKELDLENVVTFFHEFAGHGFDLVFKFGTRSLEKDIEEAPSTFFGNFALEKEVLAEVLKERNGTSISEKLLEKMVKSHHFIHRYRAVKQQWIDSRFLLDFFDHVPKTSDEFAHLNSLFLKAQKAVDPISTLENTYPFLIEQGITDLSIGSLGYKYLLDKAIGLLFLARFKKEGLFNRQTWDDYIKNILIESGYRYSLKTMSDFLKRPSGLEDIYDLETREIIKPGMIDDAIREFERYYSGD